MTLANVLFDEAHSEAWTIRPELAATMQPAHPGDRSYALAADALTADGFSRGPNATGPLAADALAACEVLVIAHPSDVAWERTTGTGSPRLIRRGARCGRARSCATAAASSSSARPSRRSTATTSTSCSALRAAPGERHRPGLRAPLRRRPELGPRCARGRRTRTRRRPARTRQPGVPLSHDDESARRTARASSRGPMRRPRRRAHR